MSSNPDIAISVRNLGECYRIYGRPQDRLKQSVWRCRQYFRELWALNDVSFDVKKGETVGIIASSKRVGCTVCRARISSTPSCGWRRRDPTCEWSTTRSVLQPGPGP